MPPCGLLVVGAIVAVAMLSPFLLGSGLLRIDDLSLSVLGYVEIGVEVGGGGISFDWLGQLEVCLLYTSPSPRDATLSRMPSSA